MHPEKTKQPYIRSARKNRTRKKKSAVEEDARKSPEKNKTNEPLEQLKSTESLKRERLKNKPGKRTKYTKTALEIAKKETPKDRKAKNKPELKKLASEQIRAVQTGQKTTPQEKSRVEDGSGKQREKVTLRREKGCLLYTSPSPRDVHKSRMPSSA